MATKFATKTITRDGDDIATGVTITFNDGRKVAFTFADLSAEIIAELIAWGAREKLGDSYSGAAGNVDYAYAECSAVAEALTAGQWNRRGTSGGGLLVEAVMKVTGQPEDVIAPRIAAMDEEAVKLLKKQKAVKAAMAKIRADRLAADAGADTADLAALFAGADAATE